MRLFRPHALPTIFYQTMARLFRLYVAALQDANDLPDHHRRLKLRMLAVALVAAQIHGLPLTLPDVLRKTGVFRCRVRDHQRWICRAEARAGRPVPEFAASNESQRLLLQRIVSPFEHMSVESLMIVVQRMRRTNPKLAKRSHRMLLLTAVRVASRDRLFGPALYSQARALLFTEACDKPAARMKCDRLVDALARRFGK
jgi:hypothetical protein